VNADLHDPTSRSTRQFIEARDSLIRSRDDLQAARLAFRWPRLEYFNWVRHYFDHIAQQNNRCALRVVTDKGLDESWTYCQLSSRSAQITRFMQRHGIQPQDRVLVMLGNVSHLWQVMLALIRMGAVIVPATTLLQPDELADRLLRGAIKGIVTEGQFAAKFALLPGAPLRFTVGSATDGWIDLAAAESESAVLPDLPVSRSADLLFLYFTSGTTARPKLVAHTHQSYPIGHLSTMYWLGLQKGDVHLNLSSPGWAKHAWSSFFAPWNAEASIVALQQERFHPEHLLDELVRCQVTSFCAPPTVWRMLTQLALRRWKTQLRAVTSAGEPLNAEVIERVRKEWGLELRDGFGQTETTALLGNGPRQPIKTGSMGRPLPGYDIALLAPDGIEANEGEICVDLTGNPLGVMSGYVESEAPGASGTARYHRTGDIAKRDADGYYTYIGRMDDVFKSSDYRISPFEIESMLIQHPAVVEAAVVPTPDPVRLAIPKAYVFLAAGFPPTSQTALELFQFSRRHSSPYKRLRRIEFGELPKTVSGKIRRIDLRRQEEESARTNMRRDCEFREEDFVFGEI
jgi:acetyl-CoA synthetase